MNTMLKIVLNYSPVKLRFACRHRCACHKNTKGFTLIELLVTLSVGCILLLVAIPSLHTMIMNSRITASLDSLVNNFNYAREVALNNNANIQVCPFAAANSTSCGTNWSNGWIVVTQPNTGMATLLRSKQNTMGPTINSNVTSIIFTAHGLSSNQSNFTFCDDRGSAYARSVEVMATGFIQAGQTAGTAVWNNASLTCP